MTACLEQGPWAAPGRALVDAARALGTSPMAMTMRAWLVPQLFYAQEQLFARPEDPTQPLADVFARCTATLRASRADVAASEAWPRVPAAPASDAAVETITGTHYGNLFSGFAKEHYWDEATALLRARLERNGIELELAGKSVIDAGCGGGRYTVAWRQLGAAHALGVDVSPINIATARARVQEAGLADVDYRVEDVLALQAPDDAFDIVFSNGVLHHTRDWRAGIGELVRVLAPNGLGWLYLIENPGGLFWDMIEILREITHGDSHELARRALEQLELPRNRIFYMLDHVMVPINDRLRPDEIEAALRTAGARDIRRLTRGADFDRVEQIHRGAPHAVVKFGVGENRYVFTK
jgi:2-polyprenyl-3-methyl-5-hydroxy-6-metoxy-1,4-benzoquinol methylase